MTHTQNIQALALEAIRKQGDEDPPITNKVRKDWNNYVGWLDKQGLKGNPALDKDELGGKMIDKYREENPGTSITREMITPIQQDFSNYKNYIINKVKKGEATYAPGVNDENLLKDISKVDGWAGQFTTSFSYPPEYLKIFENGKLVSNEHKGFADTGKKL